MSGLFTNSRDEIAINRIKEMEPDEGYYLAFSGGKDSVVILDLANCKRDWTRLARWNIDRPGSSRLRLRVVGTGSTQHNKGLGVIIDLSSVEAIEVK